MIIASEQSLNVWDGFENPVPLGFCDNLSRQVQPPDAENRMSGGVGGVTGAIPLPPPDQLIRRTVVPC